MSSWLIQFPARVQFATFRNIVRACLLIGISSVLSSAAIAADKVTAEAAMAIQPILKDSECDMPGKAVILQCKIAVGKFGKGSGWTVSDPAGLVLRRFVDSNGDDVVDQFRYYNNGVEVYRDIDTDFNRKVDQMRWFNTSGSRWAIDKNEDGKIDSWKVLSPEEASREVVKALVARDERYLGTLMMTPDDLARLGINGPVAETIQKNFTKIGDQLDKLSQSKLLQSKAQWMQFQGTFPSIIPADQIGSRDDILAHQNAMTMVDNAGQTGLIQLGTLIKVGDVWKLTRLPQALEGNSVQVAEDALFSPIAVAANNANPAGPMPNPTVDPKSQKLVEVLQSLDKSTPPPTASKAAWAKFNRERTLALKNLIDASGTPEEREQWEKQMVDGIAAGVQADTYDKGMEQLAELLETVQRKSPKSSLIPYAQYRIMTAKYGQDLRKAPADKTAAVQEQWLTTLSSFVTQFPSSEDAPEAMFQLGSTYEFAGKLKDAREWYDKLAKSSPKTPVGLRAAGALNRLDSKGQPFVLKGTTLSGAPFDIASLKQRKKVALVIYWSNWSEPLVNDLPQIQALHEKYSGNGLEIVGISLDSSKEEAQAWIKQHKTENWTQLFEPGGLEGSPLAIDYGIIMLPSLFVVDQNGKVIHRGTAAEELKPFFIDLFQDKKGK